MRGGGGAEKGRIRARCRGEGDGKMIQGLEETDGVFDGARGG